VRNTSLEQNPLLTRTRCGVPTGLNCIAPTRGFRPDASRTDKKRAGGWGGVDDRQNRCVHDPEEVTAPFRWDLITPDQLGSLLEGTVEPDVWFAPALVRCAGKVLARSGGGDLFFVGRSLDSMFDLLGGALSQVPDGQVPYRLPFSFERPAVRVGAWRWRARPLNAVEITQARRVLSGLDLTPQALVRRARPATFVDVVARGSTFTELFTLLRDWIERERAPWATVRKKIRCVGVTSRTKTSPNTFRWQQHADWTRRLPARSVVNVSLQPEVWSYLANHQTKLTRSYRPERWLAEVEDPARDDRTRQALAEAVALVQYGRSPQGRKTLALAIDGEPNLNQPWLRSLVRHLNTGT